MKKKESTTSIGQRGWKSRLLSLAYALAMGTATISTATIATASLVSCSSSDDDGDNDTNVSEKASRYIIGKKMILDWNKRTNFSFYKNHLVVCDGGSSISSGQLAGGTSLFFGSWYFSNNKLITSFTSGTNGGFNWNSILYSPMTIQKLDLDNFTINFTDNDGKEHQLTYYSIPSQENTFTDYTDDSDHDQAITGTWHMNVSVDGQPTTCTMEISKDGTTHFKISALNSDVSATSTTKNGHVTFSDYLLEKSNVKSFIYIRTEDKIQFFTEDNAVCAWTWYK